jgi:hypothetical protein
LGAGFAGGWVRAKKTRRECVSEDALFFLVRPSSSSPQFAPEVPLLSPTVKPTSSCTSSTHAPQYTLAVVSPLAAFIPKKTPTPQPDPDPDPDPGPNPNPHPHPHPHPDPNAMTGGARKKTASKERRVGSRCTFFVVAPELCTHSSLPPPIHPFPGQCCPKD